MLSISRAFLRIFALAFVIAMAGCGPQEDAGEEAPAATTTQEDAAPEESAGEEEEADAADLTLEETSTDMADESASSRVASDGETSGVEGRALIGPECPATRIGEECPDRPYQTTLLVRDAGTQEVIATAECDEEGLFRVELAPGAYVLEPQPRQLVMDPKAEPLEFVVEAGRYTQVVMRYDSGKR